MRPARLNHQHIPFEPCDFRRLCEGVGRIVAFFHMSDPLRDSGETEVPAHRPVLVREVKAPRGVEPLEWMLLTKEPVGTLEQATTVVGYYEKRWLIEEFHKAWKSGCRVEHRPLQSLGNLERMMVITSHVAVRLLQLRSSADELGEKSSCEPILERDEWECLHAMAKPGKPIPKRPPTARWALESIARLGGWQDTKRTGRIGWQTLWHGWDIFQNRFVGWRMALNLARPP